MNMDSKWDLGKGWFVGYMPGQMNDNETMCAGRPSRVWSLCQPCTASSAIHWSPPGSGRWTSRSSCSEVEPTRTKLDQSSFKSMTWFSSRVSMSSSEVFSKVLPVRWRRRTLTSIWRRRQIYFVCLVIELKSFPADFQVLDHLFHCELFAGFVNNVVNLSWGQIRKEEQEWVLASSS